MSEQKRYFIGKIHRRAARPDVIYACLFDRNENPPGLVISATMDYILDATRDRFPGQVEGVEEDWPRGKSTQQTKVQAASIVVPDRG